MFQLAVIATTIALASAANQHDRAYYEAKFYNWLNEFKIKVESGDHFVKMLQNFANNEDLIQSTNAKELSYTLGHNKFSHLSFEEWKAYVRLGLSKPTIKGSSVHTAPVDLKSLPDAVDWVVGGRVSDVKDQGQCGSCWSFSTTGALEGAYEAKYGLELPGIKTFSEQHLVDCDNFKTGGTDLGCNGGLMDSAFTWIIKNQGICAEAEYPYVSGTTKARGTCAETSCVKDAKVAPKSFTDVAPNSDAAMMSAIAQQPVSIAIEADQAAFQLYKSGVFTASCGTNLDHGVLAVGYGTLNGVDYYKVKNSWGTSWGQDGYILLARGISQVQGQCGILSEGSYPNL
jgi:C1A family cysteine protease